jgi:hypothetical protein
VPYTREQGNNFWFEYDDHFLFHPPADVLQAYQIIRGPDYIRTRWKERRRTSSYPAGFVTDVTPLRAGLVTLLLDIDAARWVEINNYVALAWAIQSEALPVPDTHNPGLSAGRLQAQRDFWLPKTALELEAAFDRFPYPDILA